MGSPGHLVWCLMVSESRLLLPQFAIFSMWLRPEIKNSSPTSTVRQAEIKEQRGKQPSNTALRSLTVGHKYTNTSHCPGLSPMDAPTTGVLSSI